MTRVRGDTPMIRSVVTLTLMLGLAVAAPAHGADRVKVGFIATFSGPLGQVGQHMYDGFALGLEHSSGKLGGLPTEVIKEDDQLKPDVGLQVCLLYTSDAADERSSV